jgi:hypothetical protein
MVMRMVPRAARELERTDSPARIQRRWGTLYEPSGGLNPFSKSG